MGDDTDERLRKVEQDQAVHEAVCAERYKGIMLRLNVVMAGIGLMLVAVSAGNPVLATIGRLLGAP